MASEQTFSEWYFEYCKARNRTPSMEEVWSAALATQPAAPSVGEPVAQWQIKNGGQWCNVDREPEEVFKAKLPVRALYERPLATPPAAPAATEAPSIREFLGKMVRAEWVKWAAEQPTPKASWLAPWDSLTEPEREVDRRIGEAIWRFSYVRDGATPPAAPAATALKAARVALDSQKDATRYQWLRARPALIRKLVLELGYGYDHTPGAPMSGGVYLDETLDEVIASGVDAWGREVESVAASQPPGAATPKGGE